MSLLLIIILNLTTLVTAAVSNVSKAGLAWPNGPEVDIRPFLSTGKVSWYYSWTPKSFSGNSPVEFVPMFWGNKSEADWTSSINQTIAQHNVTAVLGMNEPQQSGQSNLTPQQGAELWKTYLEPLRSQGIRLGSPAPSSAQSGKTWLLDFLAACAGGCTVDFIALHWYDVNATRFIQYLNDFNATFNRPIWVTEWACQNFNNASQQCSYNDIVSFMNTTQTFMDNAPFVERYAWFGAMRDMSGVNPNDALMNNRGSINDLGMQYIGAEPPKFGTPGSSHGPDGFSGATISFCAPAIMPLIVLMIVTTLCI